MLPTAQGLGIVSECDGFGGFGRWYGSITRGRAVPFFLSMGSPSLADCHVTGQRSQSVDSATTGPIGVDVDRLAVYCSQVGPNRPNQTKQTNGKPHH